MPQWKGKGSSLVILFIEVKQKLSVEPRLTSESEATIVREREIPSRDKALDVRQLHSECEVLDFRV